MTRLPKTDKITPIKAHLWKHKVAKPESKTVTCSNDSSAATTGEYRLLQPFRMYEKELLQLQDIDSFLREVKDCKENIMIGEFQDNALTKEWLYYWKNNQIFEYDLNRQIKSEVGAVQVRRELLRLLAIDEEVKNYA